MMDTYTLKQDATIVELSGNINTKNNQGEDVKLRIGDTLKQNATFTVSAGTTFTLQYSDGSTATQDDLAINPIVTDSDAQSSETLAAAVDPEVVDPEIAALQAQILSGEDPTDNLPDTAAGETAQAGNEGGGYVAVSRTGDETLANAGHDTAGFEQIEFPRIDELPVFLTEFALPKVSARAVTLFEKHLDQGSEPQAAQLSQAENVSVNVQAGIQDLSINGVVVFEQGNFVGPVVITTPNGVLLISAYDSIDSILTYSYTLASTLDHSNSDTIAEIFVLQLTDNQGVSTTSVVTANIVDDAPSGLDDINVISQSNLDGVAGNVLQNDTLGADSAAVTQIINSQNSSNDVAGNTAISGIYGSLIIAADGSYHYQLNNQLPEIQSLALGEQLIESFNYLLTDSDGDSVTQALTITISGENDAPEITSSFEDALGNVTEAGVLVGGNIATDGIPQASGTLTANDIDNGAVLTWQLDDDPVTPYGIFSLNESTGEWSFTLDNEFANSLGYGDTETETFNITVTDEFGLSDTQMFTVTITGTNDIPVLSFAQGADAGIVKEAGVVDINDEGNTPVAGIDSVSGQFNADDVDINDGETWSVQGTPNTEYGQFSVDSNGLWTYALDNDLADSLFEGQIVILNYTVRVTDNYGAYTDQNVTITITGTNDIPVLSFEEGADAGMVKEAGVVDINDEGNTPVAGIDSVSGQFNADDVDINDGETWSVQGTPNTEYGQFSVDSNGLWTYALDNDLADSLFEGQVVVLNYTVRVTDNYGAYADQDVTITITGTNDIPVLSFEEGADAGIVKEAGVVDINDEGNTPVAGIDSVSGQFNADDVDINDGETWSVQGTPNTEYGQFSVDSNGLWTYALDNDLADSLFEGQVVVLNYTVRVTDNYGAYADQDVTITITGTNDIPVLSFEEGADAGMVKEAGVVDINDEGNTPVASIDSVSGQFNADDVDINDGETWSVQGTPNTEYGQFSVDSNGLWTFALDNDLADSLFEGQVVILNYTVRVTDNYGAYADQDVTITITGTNDIPVLSFEEGADAGIVKEAGVVDINDEGNTPVAGIDSVSGQFNADDVDINDGETWSVQGTPNTEYGQFSVDSNGLWTYALDNDLADSLFEGQVVILNYTVRVTDNYGAYADQDVTITITGTNDIPVLSFEEGADAGMVKEAGVVDINDEGNTPVAGIDSVSGQFNADDVDINDGETWSVQGTPNTEYGQFSVDNNGLWTYALDNDLADSLFEGQVVILNYSVRVTDNYGAYADQDVTITITGTNDIPVISFEEGADAGIVKEAGVVDINDEGNTPVAGIDSVSGQFNADDVDINDGETWSVQGTPNTEYGQFSVDSNGLWTYALDNDLADSLFEGQIVILNYTVRVTDNYGAYTDQNVTITITGTNDIPVLTADTSGAVTEDLNVVNQLISDSGALSFTDVDTGDTALVSSDYKGDIAWSGGDLSLVLTQDQIDQIVDGFSADQDSWDFSVANDLIQFLAATESISLSFDVTVTDTYGAYDTEEVTITISGVNDGIEGEFEKEIWVPASLNEITDPYLSGYPLFIAMPTDIDFNDSISISNLAITLLTQGLDPDVELGNIYYMADGDNTLSLIDFNSPPILSASELETLLYVPGDNGDVDYQVDLAFTFQVNSGIDSVDGEFIIHSVPANGLADQTVQIGDGSSPLTSGNPQDADLVITELFANALNSDPASGSLLLFTDFQQTPVTVPVPINERGANTNAGAAREMEVSARLTIGSAIFEVIPDNDGDGIITWSYDADSGLMKAEVDYSAIYLLDGNGDPTTTSLADYIIANPVVANDIWRITYLDNNGGNFQARFVEAVFTHEQIADDSITVVGTDNINNLIFGSTNTDSLTGANLDDRIFGREDNDILIGLSGNDELVGGSGDDNIQGGEDNDFVIGGIGNDLLDGGVGRDYLSGGQGNDSLDGGELNGSDDGERDFFVWESDTADNSTDTVFNFNPDIDVLDLSDLLISEESGNLEDFLSFSFSGGNTTITIDADGLGSSTDGVLIVLNGVDLSAIYGSTDASTIIAELITDEALIVDPNTTPYIPPYDQIDDGLNLP